MPGRDRGSCEQGRNPRGCSGTVAPRYPWSWSGTAGRPQLLVDRRADSARARTLAERAQHRSWRQESLPLYPIAPNAFRPPATVLSPHLAALSVRLAYGYDIGRHPSRVARVVSFSLLPAEECHQLAHRLRFLGTYLGDNYNDVPSSFQRARELTVRIDETRATLGELKQKGKAIAAQLVAEQKRLTARSSAALMAPIGGSLWTVQAAAGEYVRKGQELFTVLDCSTVVVTASVSERDYKELRLGDPVRFRVAGSDREYSGDRLQARVDVHGPELRHFTGRAPPSGRGAVGRSGPVQQRSLRRRADGRSHLRRSQSGYHGSSGRKRAPLPRPRLSAGSEYGAPWPQFSRARRRNFGAAVSQSQR